MTSLPKRSTMLTAVNLFRTWRVFSRTILATGLLLSCVLAGCNKHTVSLVARDTSPRNRMNQEIHVQISGSLEGIRYKWFADAGECFPQESDAPVTQFRFADDVISDTVTVGIWRDGKWVTQGSINLKRDTSEEPPMPEVKIEILQIPLAQKGGPETRADIAGRVSGAVDDNFKVLLYARDGGVWYLQPFAYSKHDIKPDRTWSAWTHTGYAYAALVVRPDFIPLKTVDTIPPVKGSVVARVVVDGREN